MPSSGQTIIAGYRIAMRESIKYIQDVDAEGVLPRESWVAGSQEHLSLKVDTLEQAPPLPRSGNLEASSASAGHLDEHRQDVAVLQVHWLGECQRAQTCGPLTCAHVWVSYFAPPFSQAVFCQIIVDAVKAVKALADAVLAFLSATALPCASSPVARS